MNARITDQAIDPHFEFSSFLERVETDGAVISFLGIARPAASTGAPVERIFLDHHPSLSPASVMEVAKTAKERFAVSEVTILHRYGAVRPGEVIVFVAAASAHRRAAFDAADYMMDLLKTEAVFWKREDAADGSRWIEPTEADNSERARWSK